MWTQGMWMAFIATILIMTCLCLWISKKMQQAADKEAQDGFNAMMKRNVKDFKPRTVTEYYAKLEWDRKGY